MTIVMMNIDFGLSIVQKYDCLGGSISNQKTAFQLGDLILPCLAVPHFLP